MLHFDKNIRSCFILIKISKPSVFYTLTMPLSLDEATKRYESYSHNIQDSILTIESYMGSNTSISFDMPQVIANLETVDTQNEERNVTAYIKVLEEYQRMIITERKRRALKEVIKGKFEAADFKMNLKSRRRAQRLAQMSPPNAGQMPTPNAGQMPKPNAQQMPPPNAGQMSTPNAEQLPAPNDELMLDELMI